MMSNRSMRTRQAASSTSWPRGRVGTRARRRPDGADRRRRLPRCRPQLHYPRPWRWPVGQVRAAETLLPQFAFGTSSRWTGPAGWSAIRLRGARDETENLGGLPDADHQHAGGHRVQVPAWADLAGARRHGDTGRRRRGLRHPARLVDDDDPACGGHSTIAVAPTRRSPSSGPRAPSAAAHRAAGSIRIFDENARRPAGVHLRR